MKKYEGSWMNHIKEGQKKTAKEIKAETKMELVIINPFDGCGISHCNSIEKLNREFVQSIMSIKTL